MPRHLHFTIICLIFSLVLPACNMMSNPPTQAVTVASPSTSTQTLVSSQTQTHLPTNTPTITIASTPTRTSTRTRTPTQSLTPTITNTPTIISSPTYSLPTLTVLIQANCRYGPGKAYLYAWGMYPGDTGTVWGRDYSGSWLWIQPDNIAYQCWISSSVVEVNKDTSYMPVAPVRLPHSVLYAPPGNITTVWNGDSVTVSWQAVNMTEITTAAT